MATLALGLIGSAIGGAIGGTVLGISAAAIGGFIGSQIGGFVDNLLFPTHFEGPRLTDLSVSVSTYGNAIPKSFGPENRLAGNVIWSSGLIERSHTNGSKGSETTLYDYSISVAIALGDRESLGIAKVWNNAKLIYDSVITDSAIGTPQGAAPQFFGGVIGAARLAIWLNHNRGLTHSVFSSIKFYPGNFEQLPDPTIESYLGVGEVPGYRGTCYVVLEGLQLKDTGNRLGNVEFLLIADEEISVGEVAREIAGYCGIDFVRGAALCDALRGYTIGRQTTGVSALQPLQMAYDFDTADRAGSIWFVKRGMTPEGTISSDDLGAHEAGQDRPSPLQWTRLPVTQMPRESVVTFKDPERDYQPNSARAQRQTGSADSNLSADLALVLSVDEGRKIADRALWEAWTNQTAKTAVSDDLIDLQAGCVYLFDTPAGLEPLRVVTRRRGANGVIELELRRDRTEVYNSTMTGAAAAIPTKTLNLPGPSELILLDIPLMIDADDGPGFYFAVTTSATDWRGADVLRALSPTDDYVEVQPVGALATVGDVDDTVPDCPPGYDPFDASDFDDVTTIVVDLRRAGMTLTSKSDAELDAGGNACFIGNADDTTEGEVLQFGTATPISGGINSYELSHLRRGRRGTEFATGLHSSGPEIFVLLDSAMRHADYGSSDLEQEHAFKAVSLMTAIADATAVLFTDTGVGLRPYSPVDLDISGDTGGDLTLSWTGRFRLSSGAPGLGEEVEQYRVRIMNGASIIRETVVSTTSFRYTAPMQATDFGSAVGDLTWKVAKINSIYGDGIYSTFDGPVPVPGSSGDVSPDAPDGTLEQVDL
jgi:hypothetical protein